MSISNINSNNGFDPNYNSSKKRKRSEGVLDVGPYLKREKIETIQEKSQESEPTFFTSENIKQQINLIESLFFRGAFNLDQLLLIREKIQGILSSELPEEKIMAELGILYFYAEQNELDCPFFYFDAYKDTLESQLASIKKSHKQTCPAQFQKIFASGKMSFLYTNFAQLIFSSQGDLNLGGCYAVIELLNTSISRFITEENRIQILASTQKLIHDLDLQDIFLETFEIHEDVKRILCLDLKLPYDAELSHCHIQWAMLQSLYSRIGQSAESNCYSIAILFNFVHENPACLLRLVKETLVTGHFEFENTPVSVSFLLNLRKIYEIDFQTQCTAYDLESMEFFALIKQSCPLHPDFPFFDPSVQMSIESWLEVYFGKEMTHLIKPLMLSYKVNYLQQLMLGIMQWIGLNNSDYIDRSRSPKYILFNRILAHFKNDMSTLGQAFLTISDFFNNFLVKHFWLADAYNPSFSIKNNRIIFPNQAQGFLLKNLNESSLLEPANIERATEFKGPWVKYEPFSNGRRFYFYNETKEFQPVDKISEFIDLIESLFYKYCELNSVDKKKAELFETYLEDKNFKNSLAKIISELNQLPDFTEDVYENSDTFCLLATGSKAVFILGSKKLEVQFGLQSCNVTNEREFFLKLCNALNAYLSIHPLDSRILFSNNSHTFNLYPDKFAHFLSEDAEGKIDDYMQEHKHKLDKVILSDEIKRKIFVTAAGGEEPAEKILKKLPSGEAKIQVFRNQVLQAFGTSKLRILDHYIDKCLREIDLQNFYPKIHKILNELHCPQDDATLLNMFFEDAPRFVLPFQLADLLQKFLIKNGWGFFPSYFLEQKICEQTQFREVIELGNLNWIDSLTEDLSFSKLILKFHLAEERFVLCERRAGREKVINTSFTECFFKKSVLYLKQ